MQGISIYKNNNTLFYHTFHKDNGKYLERENEKEKFLVLYEVDDCSPSEFSDAASLNRLINDLNITIQEATLLNDIQSANHLKEIVVLCKMCLWNIDSFILVLSPFEYIPKEDYSKDLPQKYRESIASIGQK